MLNRYRATSKLILLVSLCLLIPFSLWIFPIFKKKPEIHVVGSAFFVPISIAGYTVNKIPCLNVKIEEQKFLFKLDLGLNSPASMQSEFLQKISHKSIHETITGGGFRGTAHKLNIYKIPKIMIDFMSFHPVLVREDIPSLAQESQIGEKLEEPMGEIVGKIGWKIFRSYTLFLDFRRSMIIVADSVETFKEHGPSLKTFAKVPMLQDGDHIEFESQTSKGPLKGPLRCLLDTGCTLNFINTKKNQSAEELIHKKKKFSSLQIGGREYGPFKFHKLPMRGPIELEAILGMEFLSKHAVFIDFKNQEIYFSK